MNNPQKIDLKEYIFQCKNRLERILDRLEWSKEDTLKDYNTNSVASSLKKVEKKVRPPVKATYPASCITQNSVVLESSQLQQILQNNKVKAPGNFRELQENFSREQKLKIYEYVIENTEKLGNITTEQEVEGEISLADILAQKKREEKHKKRRFRKSQPTHIEEVRCLVNLQMQALQQFVENKIKKESVNLAYKTAKYDSEMEGNKNRDERKRFEDYRREASSKKLAHHNETTNGIKRRHRSRSKEHIRHKHKRKERSINKELSYTRKRCTKSRSKERRKRHRSSSNEGKSFRSYVKDNSKERRNHRRRSNERRSRSHIKDISKKRKKHSQSRSSDRYKISYSYEISKDSKIYGGIRDYETCTRREEHNYGKYPRIESRSIEITQRSRRERSKYYDDEYKNSKPNSNYENDKHCVQYETPSNSKSSKRKQKKHERS